VVWWQAVTVQATSGKTMMISVMCHIVLWLCERKRRRDTTYDDIQVPRFYCSKVHVLFPSKWVLTV
jgi:hypothetical protein